MDNNALKIIVKVGKRSKLRFSHSEVLRAIMAEDLTVLTNKYKDCSIVIIEGIDESEHDALKSFIESYTKNESNSVLFYIPDVNDSVTSGLADELNYDIYMDLNNLYGFINKKYNVNVSTFLDDRRAAIESSDDEPDGVAVFGFDGLAEDIDTADSEDEVRKAEEEKLKHEEEQRQKEELERQEKELQKQKEEQLKREEERKKQRQQEEKLRKEREEALKLAKKEKQQAAVTAMEKDAELESAATEISELKKKLEDAYDKLNDSEDRADKLELELKESEHENAKVVRDIKEANTRVLEYEQLIKVVKDEKRAIELRFNELFSTEVVLEDPISLAEYDKIRGELDECRTKIKSLESSVEKYKNCFEEEKLSVVEKEASINKLEGEIKELRDRISSGEIHKEVIEKHKRDIANLMDERNELQNKIDSLKAENSELSDTVNRHENTIESEMKYRKLSRELAQIALSKVSELQKSFSDINKELEDTKKKYTGTQNNLRNSQRTIEEQTNEINGLKENVGTLEEKLKETEQRLELSTTYSDTEIAKLTDTKTQLEAQLKLVSENLRQREEQYNALMANSSGAQSVAETNKTLETLNKTLSEKLSVANANIEKMKRERVTLQGQVTTLKTQADTYKGQAEQLNKALKNIASSGAVDAGTAAIAGAGGGLMQFNQLEAVLKPFRYNAGQGASIIPVFGTGSIGITTTAMSLAYKLGMGATVLYIDFDLVNPKADIWFNKVPSSKVLASETNLGAMATGLGVFYALGAQGFKKYADKLINCCDVTKGGKVDYVSGLYQKIDPNKMIAADYSGLLNFLSTKYSYIVIDLGRIGSSDIGDILIKRFTEISVRGIAVTRCDLFEARSLRIKLDSIKINSDKVAWLLNMCVTSLPEKMNMYIQKSKYGMVNYDSSISVLENGQRNERFSRSRLTKDKFELFLNSAVFS